MATKKKLKPRDRFSHRDGYGYVLNENQAILVEPKSGKSPKYVYVSEIPEDARFTVNCPPLINLMMDALDWINDLGVREEKLVGKEEMVEAG